MPDNNDNNGNAKEGDEKRQINGLTTNKSDLISRRAPRGNRYTKRTDPRGLLDKQIEFLKAFELVGTITGAAREVIMSKGTHHYWMRLDKSGVPKDKKYYSAFEQAEESAVELMISEARRRGIVGTERDVRWKGEVVGIERKYSDNLLMFLIKAQRPEYRDRYEPAVAGTILQVELSTIRQIHSEVESERKTKMLTEATPDIVVDP